MMSFFFSVGMVSKQSESAEFHIQNEDFPALPGSAAMNVMKAVCKLILFCFLFSILIFTIKSWVLDYRGA